MLSLGLFVNPTFLHTSKPRTMLRSTLFVFCFLLNTLFRLFFEVKLVITSAGLILFHSNVEKHYSYFCFSVLTTVEFFYWLFWNFETLKTYTAPSLFVGRVHQRNYYIYGGTLTTGNISATLFVFCLSLNMFVLPLCGILTWKSICWIVAVYTLMSSSAPYFFFYNR